MYLFDNDIALTVQKPFCYTGNVTDNWSVNGNPNGGYIMAILGNAIIQKSDKKKLVILTANFISRSIQGEAWLAIEKMGSSKQFQRWEGRVQQEGKETIRVFGTCTDEADLLENRYEKRAPELTPLDDCVVIPEIPNYTIFRHMDVRLDPGCAGWLSGNLTERSEQKGWIKFKDNRPFDQLSILLLTDSFPPPILASQGIIAWIPTIEMSVNIRSIPKSKWLKSVFRSRFINGGFVEEDGELWDEEGELVAISRQISLFQKK
jgi:hypothetical protein